MFHVGPLRPFESRDSILAGLAGACFGAGACGAGSGASGASGWALSELSGSAVVSSVGCPGAGSWVLGSWAQGLGKCPVFGSLGFWSQADPRPRFENN